MILWHRRAWKSVAVNELNDFGVLETVLAIFQMQEFFLALFFWPCLSIFAHHRSLRLLDSHLSSCTGVVPPDRFSCPPQFSCKARSRASSQWTGFPTRSCSITECTPCSIVCILMISWTPSSKHTATIMMMLFSLVLCSAECFWD